MERVIENGQKLWQYLRQAAFDRRRYEQRKPNDQRDTDDGKDNRSLTVVISLHLVP